jgi:hypothetical protein
MGEEEEEEEEKARGVKHSVTRLHHIISQQAALRSLRFL